VSEANIVVPVIDHDSRGKAAGVEEILSQGGFDVDPGILDYAAFAARVRGTVLAYVPEAADEAAVIHNYFPNIRQRQVDAGTLGSYGVALCVTHGYEAVPPGAGVGGVSGPNCVAPAP